MPTCHLITIEFYPTPGGLQESLVRIAQLINAMEGWTTRIYVRDEHNQCDEVGGIPGLEVISVGRARRQLMAPINPQSPDQFRSDYLIIRREVERSIQERPTDPQVVLSFGLPHNGFLAQQVALTFGLPHVSCFRGTDFSRDCFEPYQQSAIVPYVVQRVTAIVTTNEEQKRFLKSAFGPKTNIVRIYNGVEPPKTLWHPRHSQRIKLAADCGFAFKKGTHLLLAACERLVKEGFPIELSVCGVTAPGEEEYWAEVRSGYETRFGSTMRFRDVISKAEVIETLLNSDLYCSATLGEGCSLARSRALLMGMPIVSTRCGELADLAAEVPHVFLAPPGDGEAFQRVLKSACERVIDGTICVDHESMKRAQSELSVDAERTAWRNLLSSTVPSSSNRPEEKQFRVLLYVHDGRGLGHLRRLSRLAKMLQGECAVLIVTGLREASWIVPETCEFIHLPSLESIDAGLSTQWGRRPFWNAGRKEGLRVRRDVIQAVVDSFAPDAIVLDFLPAGKHDEMYDVLDKVSARRYLIFRGVLGDLTGVESYILTETGRYLLEKRYDRILITADQRIVDVISEYRLNGVIAQKVKYTGYITDQVTKTTIHETRSNRGLPPDAQWVVCSVGGGKLGEDLIAYYVTITEEFPDLYFDIVLGPRSRLPLGLADTCNSRVRISRERRDLPLLHASCDVLICRGGYNSLMEAVVGQAKVLVLPIPGDTEQHTHAERLSSFFPIRVVDHIEKLPLYLREELAAGPRREFEGPLDFNGAASTARVIIDDLRQTEL